MTSPDRGWKEEDEYDKVRKNNVQIYKYARRGGKEYYGIEQITDVMRI